MPDPVSPDDAVACGDCGSKDVAAVWTGDGELRKAVCRACGWRWTGSPPIDTPETADAYERAAAKRVWLGI